MKNILPFITSLVAICLFLSLWGFYFAIRPIRITSHLSPKDYAIPFEPVSFTTDDNINISGWFIPAKNKTAKTIILMHGYPADKGDILPGTLFLHQQYNLFYFDFRYLGESGGSYSTLGKNETLDLLAAIKFLESRGIKDVIVWGFSLGGAVALMTAPLSKNISCIISESAYARLDWLANDYYRIPLLKYPLAQLTRLWGILFLGYDIKDVSPVQSAEKITVPVLLIHSTHDQVIPVEHAYALQNALKYNVNATTRLIEQYNHGERSDDTKQAITTFLTTYCDHLNN